MTTPINSPGNGSHAASEALPGIAGIESPGNGTSSSLTVSEILREPSFIAAASLLLQRTRFASMAGFDQYGGSRELFQILGYPSHITFKDYQARYRRGGIAHRIVEALPSMMGWSDFQIVERPLDEGGKRKTKFERAWLDLTTREENPIAIGSIMERADILAGIGEYSAIYLGVKERGKVGAVDRLKQEMSRLREPDDIVYLRPLDQESCEILSYVGDDPSDDVSDPRYGFPKLYRVRINGSQRKSIVGGGILNSTTKDVHWSRIIHVTHKPLDNELFSDPQLQAVWNDLMALDKVAHGGSEAVWREAVQRVLFDLDQNIGPDQIDPETKTKLKSDLEDMMHNLSQYVFTRGVTPKPISVNPIKFGENVKTIISLIAATLDLPQRRLMGSESAYASADQDKNTEEETIQSRQKRFGTPVVRQLVDRFIKYGALPKPSKYEVVWATEGKKKFKFLAGIVRDFAQANQAQKNATNQTITTPDEIRDMVLDMEPLEVIDKPIQPIDQPIEPTQPEPTTEVPAND